MVVPCKEEELFIFVLRGFDVGDELRHSYHSGYGEAVGFRGDILVHSCVGGLEGKIVGTKNIRKGWDGRGRLCVFYVTVCIYFLSRDNPRQCNRAIAWEADVDNDVYISFLTTSQALEILALISTRCQQTAPYLMRLSEIRSAANKNHG